MLQTVGRHRRRSEWGDCCEGGEAGSKSRSWAVVVWLIVYQWQCLLVIQQISNHRIIDPTKVANIRGNNKSNLKTYTYWKRLKISVMLILLLFLFTPTLIEFAQQYDLLCLLTHTHLCFSWYSQSDSRLVGH